MSTSTLEDVSCFPPGTEQSRASSVDADVRSKAMLEVKRMLEKVVNSVKVQASASPIVTLNFQTQNYNSRRAPRLFLSFSSEAEVTSSTPRGNWRECLRSSNRRATAWRTRSVRRRVRCRARSTSSRRLTRATTLRRSRSARRSEQCSWPSTTAPTLPLCRLHPDFTRVQIKSYP